MKYSTKKETEKAIKKMNCPGAFSPVFENSKWQIMNNITGEIVKTI